MVGYQLSEADLKVIDSKHLCAKCRLVVRSAVQTACGHRYCSSCIEPELSKGPIKCNICKTLISKPEVFPDKFAEREILQTHLHCLNHSHGCPWKNELRKRESHQSSCEFTPVPCVHPECGKQMARQTLPDHLQTECQYREELCSYCEQPVVVAKMKDHHDNHCPAYRVTCPNCNTELSRAEIVQHLDPTSAFPCEKIDTPCPFSQAGCSENQVLSLKERQAHLKEGVTSHVNMLLGMILDMSRYMEATLPQLTTQPNGAVNKLQRVCDKAIMGIDKVVKEFAILKGQQHDHEARIKSLEHRLGIGGGSRAVHSEAQSVPLTGDNMTQDVLRRVSNAEAKSADHEVLMVETHATIEEQRREVARLSGKLQESEQTVRQLERKLEVQDQAVGLRNLAIADLEERLNELEGSSFDGVLVWKIPQIAMKRNEAINGRTVSYYSPCFFSGPHGYKMCARIYLNGDGIGKGTHVSLFFVLMRGEYDALLRWPFRQKVTMMLLDQDNEEHLIDAFRPDPSSSSFQKPRAEMNIASGCPLFCSHEQLARHAYIRDDVMFIKLIVDKPDWN